MSYFMLHTLGRRRVPLHLHTQANISIMQISTTLQSRDRKIEYIDRNTSLFLSSTPVLTFSIDVVFTLSFRIYCKVAYHFYVILLFSSPFLLVKETTYIWLNGNGLPRNFVMITPTQVYVKHDYIMKWNHFSHYWPFVRGIRLSPMNSRHKGQWRGALMFSLKRLSK